MPTDPHVLGQRIAGLRRGQGWSQRRLAAAAGVSHGYVALLELGRLPSPGKFRLDAVARALNLRTSDALTSVLPPSAEDAWPPQPPLARRISQQSTPTLSPPVTRLVTPEQVTPAPTAAALRSGVGNV